MLTFLANSAGRVRRETVAGRTYLVAPATIIVPGVLPGSKGPLYYPADEVRNSAPRWNGAPLVVYHPQRPDGTFRSAHDAEVRRYHVGDVRNARFDGALRSEAWFDEIKVKGVDGRVWAALDAAARHGTAAPMELSTGLFTADSPAPAGSVFNGRPYTHVARDYRPDHLAILPDQVGACSVRDGCGLMVNRAADPATPGFTLTQEIALGIVAGSAEPPTSNLWSQAARAAAALARRLGKKGKRAVRGSKAGKLVRKVADAKRKLEGKLDAYAGADARPVAKAVPVARAIPVAKAVPVAKAAPHRKPGRVVARPVAEHAPARHPSRHNPDITYGNKDDRNSDDRHFDRAVRKTKAAEGKVAAKLEAAKGRKAEADAKVGRLRTAMDAADRKVADAHAAHAASKARLEALKAQLVKGRRRRRPVRNDAGPATLAANCKANVPCSPCEKARLDREKLVKAIAANIK